MFYRQYRIVAFIAAIVFASLAGIATSTAQDAPATTSPAPAAPAASSGDGETYTLGVGDKLRVTVFGEDDLSGEFEVDSGGYVRLPLIGEVSAAGMTLSAFEQDVKAKLEDGYLRDARVSVEVTNYRPFYIIGEVNSPGQYAYINGMTILNAVALAGGYTYRANTSRVYIRRNGDTDEVSEPADQTTKVAPGDFIRVPERFF